MVLMPVGIINERHEPPTFQRRRAHVRRHRDHSDDLARCRRRRVRRSRPRIFVSAPIAVPGLDATGFTAEEGIAGGRQQGGRADASDPAVTGRLEYRRAGLTAGASLWRGGAGFGLIRLDIETPAVAVSSLDARYRRGRHELRGQWSMVNISGAADLNRALQIHTGLSPNIASRLLGAYGGSGDARDARLVERTKSWCSAATRSSIRRTRCRRATCRCSSFSDRRGSRARPITRIPMSRSSWISSSERNKSCGRQRALAHQCRRGLVVLMMTHADLFCAAGLEHSPKPQDLKTASTSKVDSRVR